jgi:hypothetical protein
MESGYNSFWALLEGQHVWVISHIPSLLSYERATDAIDSVVSALY